MEKDALDVSLLNGGEMADFEMVFGNMGWDDAGAARYGTVKIGLLFNGGSKPPPYGCAVV